MGELVPYLGILVVVALLVAAARAASRRYDLDPTSDREAVPPSIAEEGEVSEGAHPLAESLGWPYWYGRGAPETPWTEGILGVDCSGYAQMGLVRLGLLSPTYSDRSSYGLAADADPIAVGDQLVGDLALYPGHVMVVYEDASGPGEHSAVIGASGGGRGTYGDDPNARVKLFDTALYRNGDDGLPDFVTYARLKPGKDGLGVA